MDLDKTLFWVRHACFYVKAGGSTIFIDPFNIGPTIKEKADLILITHAHFDHCSKDDVRKVLKPETEIICAPGCFDSGDFKDISIRIAKPGFETTFKNIKIGAVPAYNNRKERLNFHPKANNWVGYTLDIDGFRLYHAGDTDFIDEMKKLQGIGAAMMPMGGTYVMDVDEMIEASKAIKPQFTIPMHYKQLLGKERSMQAEEKLRSSIKTARVMNEVQEPKYGF